MKTIFFLTRSFPPAICGVGDHTFELYERLTTKGYNIKVITSVNEEVDHYVKSKGIEQDVYPVIRKWNYRCVKQIIGLLKREDADFVCLQYVPNSYNRYGLPFFFLFLYLQLWFSERKSCVFFHEVSVRILFGGLRSFFQGLMQRVIAYSLYVLSDFSFTSNSKYKTYFAPFQIPVKPIPPNIYLYSGEAGSKPIRSCATGRILLVTFINRCHDQVIQALADCVKLGNLDVELKIVGLGSTRTQERIVKAINSYNIAEHVSFFDKTSSSDIASLLRRADIFLQIENVNERGEGGVCSKSGVNSAAMAAGLAIISSCGDMTDPILYRNGENILFIESNSSDSISECIFRLYFDKSLRSRLSANALKTYTSFLTWDTIVDAYIDKLGSSSACRTRSFWNVCKRFTGLSNS